MAAVWPKLFTSASTHGPIPILPDHAQPQNPNPKADPDPDLDLDFDFTL